MDYSPLQYTIGKTATFLLIISVGPLVLQALFSSSTGRSLSPGKIKLYLYALRQNRTRLQETCKEDGNDFTQPTHKDTVHTPNLKVQI